MNRDLEKSKKIKFPAGPNFPMTSIVLTRRPLCTVRFDSHKPAEEIVLYGYFPTENTRQIHSWLMAHMEEAIYALLEDGQEEIARTLASLYSLARFGLRYPPRRRDSRDRSAMRQSLRQLPKSGYSLWKRELAPLKRALLLSREASGLSDFGDHPLKHLVFEARYPEDSAMRESPEGILPFIDETLQGELEEGEPYVLRLEQRGRGDAKVGTLLRQMQLLGERANVELVGRTFDAILRRIESHLQPEERRWFSFLYLPNDAFGGTVLWFDSLLHPLFDDKTFCENVVRFWALGDDSARESVEVALRAYLWSYPAYADSVIERVWETNRLEKGTLIRERHLAIKYPEFQTNAAEAFERLVSRPEKQKVEAREVARIDLTALPEWAGLTKREREVWNLYKRGLDQKEIARELGISHQAVSKHLSKMRTRVRSAYMGRKGRREVVPSG